MTILSVLQSFTYLNNVPFPGAGTIFGNSDPGARQLLHIMYEVCEELRAAACWTQQKRIYTFSTTSGRDKYLLPADWYMPSVFTDWNNDEARNLVGPLDDAQFSQRLNGGVGNSVNFEYRYFGWDNNPNSGGGQFQITPIPTSTIELSIEYLTRNLFLPKNWLPSTPYTSGTYVNVSGNIYVCDTNGTSGATPPSAQTANISDGTTQWDYVSAAYETVLADTDIPLFDEDIVKLGVKAYWRDEKGEQNEQSLKNFKDRISTAKFRLHGHRRGSFANDNEERQRYSVPLGGWL